MARTPRIPIELTRGPFSLDEARAVGITLSALRGRSWERIGARLYRRRQSSDDPWKLIAAVRRTLPPMAAFVGKTAAWLHGLDVQPANPIQVAAETLESRAGLEVRHSDTTGETQEIRGVRVTTLNRTLLDLCTWSPAVEALVVVDMAVSKGLVARDDLVGYATRRPGAARLRRLAEIAAPAESPMETRLRWLLLEARLPAPDVQRDLYDGSGNFVGRADLYYTAANLVIEFDGGTHRDRLVGDDRRQNLLVDAGYRVLRFTTADLTQRPAAVIALVTSALRASPRPR